MLRHFIAIALAAGAGAPRVTNESGETPEEIRKRLDPDAEGALLLIETRDGEHHVIPDDLEDTDFIVIDLAEHSAATHLDVAGVQRSAAGRPVDAQPGSMDAALTGMQHDLGSGTVRNTTSPEPTPSKIVEEHLREDPDAEKQPAPTEDQAITA